MTKEGLIPRRISKNDAWIRHHIASCKLALVAADQNAMHRLLLMTNLPLHVSNPSNHRARHILYSSLSAGLARSWKQESSQQGMCESPHLMTKHDN